MQLTVSSQPPSTVTAGVDFGLAVVVEDSYKNKVTNFNGSVTIALANNPGGGNMGGTLTATVVDGVASFSGLTLNIAGTGFTIEATASGLIAATTSAFDVVPAAAEQLAISSQPPPGVTAGIAFGLTVVVEDSFQNEITDYSGSATIATANNAGDGSLGGTLTATFVDGVATFSGLTLDAAGTGYTLQAATSGLLAATSSAFNVLAAAPVQLVISSQPPSSVSAGSGFGVSVVAEDRFGNTASSLNGPVTIALAGNASGGTLGGGADRDGGRRRCHFQRTDFGHGRHGLHSSGDGQRSYRRDHELY